MNKEILKEYLIYSKRAQRLKADMEKYRASAELIKKEMEECTAKAEMIKKAIASHKNFLQREILTRKFILGETHEEIGEKMGYSTRHVQRLVNDAVMEITI